MELLKEKKRRLLSLQKTMPAPSNSQNQPGKPQHSTIFSVSSNVYLATKFILMNLKRLELQRLVSEQGEIELEINSSEILGKSPNF